uniref:Band 7 domain-containing protein n=1 Tax=Acrobeloides nanus TaxID=290746 RepID=A0A914C4P4_9BILA
MQNLFNNNSTTPKYGQYLVAEVSDDEGDSTDGAESQDENQRLMEDEGGDIQIEVPAHLVQMAARSGASRQSGSSTRPRMGRRFTLNPLIFAKEERDARRQSLAQLKLSYYPKNANPDVYDTGLGACGWILMLLSWVIMLSTFPLSVCFCIKVVQEYERAVVFRLGRLIGGGAKGPGEILLEGARRRSKAFSGLGGTRNNSEELGGDRRHSQAFSGLESARRHSVVSEAFEGTRRHSEELEGTRRHSVVSEALGITRKSSEELEGDRRHSQAFSGLESARRSSGRSKAFSGLGINRGLGALEGIFFVIPCIESYTKVDLRTVSFNVPPQEILTRDSVTVSVDAVVYYRVCNATISVANVENAHHSTRLLAQTTLRNMLGTRNLSDILCDRDSIASAMQALLDEATESWGIKVERVEIKDVRLPIQLQRAMAAEAEATREARAKVIAAEGEQKASWSLHEAARTIAESPMALQLRYLQTLNSVAAEKNSTIIFPLPVELIRHFIGGMGS